MFYPTQLGRYGSLEALVRHHPSPDLKAAHLVAADGDLSPSPRPNLDQIIAMKGFCAITDGAWKAYRSEFEALVTRYTSGGGRLLKSGCTRQIRGVLPGVCVHELVPPMQYWTLRAFDLRGKDNLATETTVEPAVESLWNYVIDAGGEILVASEDLGFIKHSSIAAGLEVWAAGQLGIDGGKLRFVNLQSGHYLGQHSGIEPSTEAERDLRKFCSTVFQSYSAHLRPDVLHGGFDCHGS